MQTFWISYKTYSPSNWNPALVDALNAMRGVQWVSGAGSSSWTIESDLSASALLAALKRTIGSKRDQIAIIEIKPDAGWCVLGCEAASKKYNDGLRESRAAAQKKAGAK